MGDRPVVRFCADRSASYRCQLVRRLPKDSDSECGNAPHRDQVVFAAFVPSLGGLSGALGAASKMAKKVGTGPSPA
jgi:hypothetical protein